MALFTASGTGGMEAAAVNIVRPGQKVVCVEGGKFGRRWSEICRRIGAEVIPLTFPLGETLKPPTLEDFLRRNSEISAVFMTHVESSTGVRFDIETLTEIVKKLSDIPVVVDVLCSLAAEPFYQDEWGIDIAVSGSQKALAVPPGLSFVSVSEKGMKHLVKPRSLYWDLKQWIKTEINGNTPFTPSINLMPALQQSLIEIENTGLENIWAETARKAHAFRAAAEAMNLEIFAETPANSLTVLRLPPKITDKMLIEALEKETGFRLAGGQEELKGSVIRISHMGAVGFEDLRNVLEPLCRVFNSLGHMCDASEVVRAFDKIYHR